MATNVSKARCITNALKLVHQLDTVLETLRELPDTNLSQEQWTYLLAVVSALEGSAALWSHLQEAAERIQAEILQSQASQSSPRENSSPMGSSVDRLPPLYSDSE